MWRGRCRSKARGWSERRVVGNGWVEAASSSNGSGEEERSTVGVGTAYGPEQPILSLDL